jgi:hypothetical protein
LVSNLASTLQSTLGAHTSQTFEALSSSAKHLSRNDPKVAPIWDKYGEEIETLASSQAIPVQLRGDKNFWDKAAKIVQAEHMEDIIAERAEKLAAELRGGVETGQGGYGMTDDETDSMTKLRESQWGKRLIDRYGEKGVLRTIEKLGVTLDEYADMTANTKVIVNPNNPSEWWNRDIARGS